MIDEFQIALKRVLSHMCMYFGLKCMYVCLYVLLNGKFVRNYASIALKFDVI